MKSNKIILVLFLCIPLIFSSCASIFEVTGDVVEDVVGEVVKDSVSDVAGGFVGNLAGDFVGGVAGDVTRGVEDIAEASEKLSPDAEYYIGRTAAATILKNYKLYKNKIVTDYLNKICSTLTINSEKPYLYKGYYVAVIDTNEINAISTPGGHIFISKGLLDCATSEDALASVIAHEISHIQLGHSSKAISGERGADAFKKVLVDSLDKNIDIIPSDAIQSLNNLSDGFLTKTMKSGFSQIQEFDADNNALVLMKASGYNPYAMEDMLNVIALRTDSGSGWFKTHPKPKDRLKNVKNKLKFGRYEVIDMRARQERFDKIKALL